MPSWTNATPFRPSLRTLPPDLPRPATASRVGVLRPDEALRYFRLDRLAPSPALADWVENYWTVRWELPSGTAYRSEVLSHPAVHLSVESGTARHHGFPMPAALVNGVVTRRFTADLTGSGRVFGVKFRPGGFGAFTGRDVADLTDRVTPLRVALGDAADLTAQVVSLESDGDRAAAVDSFLAARLPGPDRRYDTLLEVVRLMLTDRSIVSVEQVTQVSGVPLRMLQRLFRRYVGVGPKWVLQRLRLHDAVALIDAGEASDLADLAALLGWYDQAHFSRDFADVVGMTPGAYLASSRQQRSL